MTCNQENQKIWKNKAINPKQFKKAKLCPISTKWPECATYTDETMRHETDST
jgi:hypothetical protein